MTAKRNILLVSPCFPPTHGGGGLRIFRTYRRVSQMLPIAPTIITEAGSHYAPGWSNFEGWPVYAVPPGLSTAGFIGAMAGFARGGLRRYSAMHLVGMDLLTKRMGLFGYLQRLPIVAELTVDAASYRPSLRGRLALLPFRRATLAIALSKRIADWMRAIGVPDSAIWRRPNPVDTATFRLPSASERQAARAALGVSGDATVHLVFGGFCARKNQRLAVEAMAHLPDSHHLILAGPDFDEASGYLDAVRQAIAAHRLDRRITLIPSYIDNATSLYFAADQLWLPSLREGLPNVVLEALCCGVPVVANEALDLASYVTEACNGARVTAIASEFSAAALALLPLSESDERRRAISERACDLYDAERLCRAHAGRLAAVIGLAYDTGHAKGEK